MYTPTMITTLAVLLSAAPLTLGLPQTSNAVSASPVVLVPWSSHPDCTAPATACKQDCGKAVDTICRKNLGLDGEVDQNYLLETVGLCTVSYIYQLGNQEPDFTKCYNTFAYINDAGKPGPDGCGGTLGGALGWDQNGNRTNDPIYAIQPKSGNTNCFTPPGKRANKPLPPDELPDGTKLSLDEECPTALSRRGSAGACISGEVGLGLGCIATCAGIGFGLGNVFGAAVGWVVCSGPCAFSAWEFQKKCRKGFKKRDGFEPRLLLDPGPVLLNARADPAFDELCAITNKLPVCPNTRQKLLTYNKCPGTEGERQAPGGGGSGSINF